MKRNGVENIKRELEKGSALIVACLLYTSDAATRWSV